MTRTAASHTATSHTATSRTATSRTATSRTATSRTTSRTRNALLALALATLPGIGFAPLAFAAKNDEAPEVEVEEILDEAPAAAATGTTAPAANAAKPAAEDEDPIVAVDPVVIEEVKEGSDADEEGPVIWFGRLHSAFVHMPLAWVVLLLLLEFGAALARLGDITRVKVVVHTLTFLAAVPAMLSGLTREEELPHDDEVETHEKVMFVFTALVLLSLILRLTQPRTELTGAKRIAYRLFVAAATLIAMLGGHLGGRIVFGADHLPF